MRDRDLLRIQQLEDLMRQFRRVLRTPPPAAGWVRAVREAIGMTNVQLAKRLGGKAPQTIEDMQTSEIAGTIQLDTLRQLAAAMGCRLVYAIVPERPIDQLLEERAEEVARKSLKRTSHSMKLEAQGVGSKEERRALARHVDRLLAGSLKRLWD